MMRAAPLATTRRGAAAIILAALLAGCSTTPDIPAGCPRVAVLDDASRLTVWRDGAGRDPTDLVFDGALSVVKTECDVADERITAELQLRLIGRLGPAAPGDAFSVPYFVAVSKGESEIRGRAVYRATLEFPGGTRDAAMVLSVDDIEIRKVKAERPPEFLILGGFQLSPAQLREAQAARRR